MKNRRMRLMAIFAAGVLSVTSMGGIVTAHAEETLSVPAEEAGAGAVQMDGKDAQAAEDGSVAASEGLIAWHSPEYSVPINSNRQRLLSRHRILMNIHSLE